MPRLNEHGVSIVSRKEFMSQKADYMYQTPIIVGTQIRLIKRSNTDRQNFKLDTDLTGNITISTDGGVTEKNLIDIDGVQLTHLEKGFVEVVAHANFFILRNRGISSADRQALINIVNSGLKNESDLKTSAVSALNTVNTEGTKIQEGALWGAILNGIPNIKTGKKWASGQKQGTGGYPLAVTGLAFEPSVVMIQKTSVSAYQYNFQIYNKNLSSNKLLVVTNSGSLMVNETSNYPTSMNDNGFSMYLVDSGTGNWSWYAYE